MLIYNMFLISMLATLALGESNKNPEQKNDDNDKLRKSKEKKLDANTPSKSNNIKSSSYNNRDNSYNIMPSSSINNRKQSQKTKDLDQTISNKSTITNNNKSKPTQSYNGKSDNDRNGNSKLYSNSNNNSANRLQPNSSQNFKNKSNQSNVYEQKYDILNTKSNTNMIPKSSNLSLLTNYNKPSPNYNNKIKYQNIQDYINKIYPLNQAGLFANTQNTPNYSQYLYTNSNSDSIFNQNKLHFLLNQQNQNIKNLDQVQETVDKLYPNQNKRLIGLNKNTISSLKTQNINDIQNVVKYLYPLTSSSNNVININPNSNGIGKTNLKDANNIIDYSHLPDYNDNILNIASNRNVQPLVNRKDLFINNVKNYLYNKYPQLKADDNNDIDLDSRLKTLFNKQKNNIQSLGDIYKYLNPHGRNNNLNNINNDGLFKNDLKTEYLNQIPNNYHSIDKLPYFPVDYDLLRNKGNDDLFVPTKPSLSSLLPNSNNYDKSIFDVFPPINNAIKLNQDPSITQNIYPYNLNSYPQLNNKPLYIQDYLYSSYSNLLTHGMLTQPTQTIIQQTEPISTTTFLQTYTNNLLDKFNINSNNIQNINSILLNNNNINNINLVYDTISNIYKLPESQKQILYEFVDQVLSLTTINYDYINKMVQQKIEDYPKLKQYLINIAEYLKTIGINKNNDTPSATTKYSTINKTKFSQITRTKTNFEKNYETSFISQTNTLTVSKTISIYENRLKSTKSSTSNFKGHIRSKTSTDSNRPTSLALDEKSRTDLSQASYSTTINTYKKIPLVDRFDEYLTSTQMPTLDQLDTIINESNDINPSDKTKITDFVNKILLNSQKFDYNQLVFDINNKNDINNEVKQILILILNVINTKLNNNLNNNMNKMLLIPDIDSYLINNDDNPRQVLDNVMEKVNYHYDELNSEDKIKTNQIFNYIKLSINTNTDADYANILEEVKKSDQFSLEAKNVLVIVIQYLQNMAIHNNINESQKTVESVVNYINSNSNNNYKVDPNRIIKIINESNSLTSRDKQLIAFVINYVANNSNVNVKSVASTIQNSSKIPQGIRDLTINIIYYLNNQQNDQSNSNNYDSNQNDIINETIS